MSPSALEAAGALAACLLAAAALVSGDRRLRHLLGALALLLAPVIVLGEAWEGERVAALRDSPLAAAAGLGLLAAVVGALALLFDRLPEAFPLLALATVALRVPVDVGSEPANLLAPLYVVIAAGTLAGLCRSLGLGAGGRREAASRGEGSAGAGGRPAGDSGPRAAGALPWALAAAVVLAGAQTTYSANLSQGVENVSFFLVPFAVLFALLREVDWSPRLLRLGLYTVVGVGLAYAAVAIWQYLAREVFLNEQLRSANQVHQYFRVNSVFFDPNIFGRYLALALVATAASLAWSRRRGAIAAASGAAAVLLGVLALTFSLSSFIALLGGLLVVAALRWGIRWAAAGAAVLAIAGGAFVLGGGVEPDGSERALRNATSGRTSLVSGGLELFADHPLRGYGHGAFGSAFAEEINPARSTNSHTEPVTVAAEQGVVGLVAYLALVGISVAALLARSPGASAARTAVVGCYAALLVHSLAYAAFITDPGTWVLLAIGVALTRRQVAGRPIDAAPAERERTAPVAGAAA